MLRTAFALALALSFPPFVAVAQTAGSGAGGLENTRDFKETQSAIDRTQAKIDQVRRENEARAREIEAIANRVGEVISTMSSQGEDNSNLRSEMQKLAGLLEIEREIAHNLKGDITKLNDRMKSDRTQWEKREKALEAKVQLAEEAGRGAEERLGAALESIAGHARVNRELTNDIEDLRKEVDQLRKENDLLRRLRSSNPSLPLQR